ncbi:MAG: acetyl-CoA C-acetyltransferase [Proteobacteria bacterium]|nr:acetyl-CoA C-acetyltransferase [Pseudomonadota bacterium]MBU4576215.1 acetyl-CoA C-acetyltransferase [Pseudomonadota bacterium]MBU4597201.1 acetyl-CoA C-acetyltransferase [Pseudomonadota bacterium]
MQEVVIAGYLRTPQSRSHPKDPERDWLHKFSGQELLAKVLPAVLERAKVKPEEVDDFIVGSAYGVNEQWTYGGRLPLFLANLSERTPAKFLDQQCASSLAAIQLGFMEITLGYADIVLAGGLEHMSRVPIGPAVIKMGGVALPPSLYSDPAFAHWDMETSLNMGLTAEKLFEQTTLTRQDLDEWGVRSHQRAAQAQADGFFGEEILPIETVGPNGEPMTVDRDQAVRADSSLEGMAALKPAFKQDGVITAGNSSPLNAGAGAMVLMSKETAKAKGIRPLATVRSLGFAGVDPTIMGAGPAPACRMALEQAGLSAGDIDVWEINEAFCVVALHCVNELGIDPERVNIKGGGIALGHPLGASGIRLTGTLARILAEKKGRWGCATACVGGGQGVAVIIERETYDW